MLKVLTAKSDTEEQTLNTITNEIHSQTFDFELLASSAQAVIRLAQHEAIKMNAPEVYPEHLFLGVLRQDEVEVAIVLKDIGLDIEEIQAQVAETFGNLNYEGTKNNLLFSRESLVCFEWAVSFATQMNSSLIFPKHLILSVLRHPRIQPLLVLLLPSQDQHALPAPLMEVEGHAYTSYIDQLIHSRVREQSMRKFNHNSLKRVFRRFERPHTTFADIQGLDGAKDKLREVVDFLRKPQNFHRSMRTYLYEVLLVGHPCTDRTLLVKATAGEAVVPLIYLSISALVELLTDLDSDVLSLDDLDLPVDEYELLTNKDLSQRGRNMIAHIFSQAKKLSPCILFIDNLDAVGQISTIQEREQWLKQFIVEMDGLDHHPSMAVIATASRTDGPLQALLHLGRFDRRIEIGSSFMSHPAAHIKLCLSCKNEVLANWKYCVYCGARLAYLCPNCGTLFMQLERARFCSECGTPQSNIQ
jgi:ATPase family associated with various cellular activities (AAA)/Double zinc ribbon/Clp amino terminal domain, pathogenicity island component